jgi:1,2-phenylacetyl-CoA epoxidase PaaB subunit
MDHSLAWVTSPFFNWQPSFNVSLTTSEDLFVRKQASVEIWQVIPLILAAALLTIGSVEQRN